MFIRLFLLMPKLKNKSDIIYLKTGYTSGMVSDLTDPTLTSVGFDKIKYYYSLQLRRV
jgi:hypothetical protein